MWSHPPATKRRYVRSLFGRIAGRYDLTNDLMSLGVHRAWKRDFVANSGVQLGNRVLDLAGGTGDIAALMSTIVGARGQIVLTDVNDAMLDRLGPAINSGAGLFLYGAPGNGKSTRARTGGHDQSIKTQLFSLIRPDAPGLPVNLADVRIEVNLDLWVVVEGRWFEVQPFRWHLAGQELLGQGRPLVGEVGFVADKHDASAMPVLFERGDNLTGTVTRAREAPP